MINYLFNLFLDFFFGFISIILLTSTNWFCAIFIGILSWFFFIIYQLYYLIVISYNPDFTYNIQ